MGFGFIQISFNKNNPKNESNCNKKQYNLFTKIKYKIFNF